MQRKNQKGFTLMELMVVIVIVAILAAVAVPLYVNYVKDAQRTEAKGAIGAIITAEQAFYQKHPDVGYATSLSQLDGTDQTYTDKLVDLTEPNANWTFTLSGTAGGFTATAMNKKDATLGVQYDYKRDGTGTGWKDLP